MQIFPFRLLTGTLTGCMRTFLDIVDGTRRVQRVDEDELHIAFLNPNPVRPGHTIVITRKVVDSVFDLDEREFGALMEFTRRTAVRLKLRLPCERVCLAAIGWQVRHAHVHLVPTNADGEFPPLPGAPASDAELAAIVARLRS
ncbi:MAG: HIT family protein [Planctomycetes bacterium]|nr:HIT family protein [Planctomycetota bacterium]